MNHLGMWICLNKTAQLNVFHLLVLLCIMVLHHLTLFTPFNRTNLIKTGDHKCYEPKRYNKLSYSFLICFWILQWPGLKHATELVFEEITIFILQTEKNSSLTERNRLSYQVLTFRK